MLSVKMTATRETKTQVFFESDPRTAPALASVYVPKWVASDLGNPKEITITIATDDDK